MLELTTGKLDEACVYLSGPMEFVADHGVEWRRKFIRLVQEKELQIDIIDPTNKPGGDEMRIGENKEHQAMLKREGRWQELQDYVWSYRHYDLRFVDNCDFLVAVIDTRVPQWGTSNEIYMAEDQRKPIFFICDGGMKNMPNWLFPLIEFENKEEHKRCNVFESVEAVIAELVGYDIGHYAMGREWILLRKHLKKLRAMRSVR